MSLTSSLGILLCMVASTNGDDGTTDASWKRQFTVYGHIAGSTSILRAGTLTSCASLCTGKEGCRSFGFSPNGSTCLLYDFLPAYTTQGLPAAETRYYWLMSSSCPSELQYILDGRFCFAIRQVAVSWPQARNSCQTEGGTLAVVDTQAKLLALRGQATQKVWVGASDVEKEGVWMWENGKRLIGGTSLWNTGQPDDFLGSQDYLALELGDRLDDYFTTNTLYFACQIPMQ